MGISAFFGIISYLFWVCFQEGYGKPQESIDYIRLQEISSFPEQTNLVMFYNSSDRYSNRHMHMWSGLEFELRNKINVHNYDISQNRLNIWLEDEYSPQDEILLKIFLPTTRNFGEAETYYGPYNWQTISLWAYLLKEDYEHERRIVYSATRQEVANNCLRDNGNVLIVHTNL